MSVQKGSGPAEAAMRRAWTLAGTGDMAGAIAALSVLSADSDAALADLAQACARSGRHGDAATALGVLVQRRPALAPLHFNHGRALAETGDRAGAEAAYRRALDRDPALRPAHLNLANLLRLDGRFAEAAVHFRAHFRLKRAVEPSDPRADTWRLVTRAKLNHDIEQFEHLAGRGIRPGEAMAHAATLREIRDAIAWPEGGDGRVALTDAQRSAVAPFYNRAWHVDDAPALPEAVLGAGVDEAAVLAAWHRSGPGIVVIDDVLSPAAFAQLRAFCLDSTIWFDFKRSAGYLGALLAEGFAAPLLVQIADAFRERLPALLARHPLRQMWAYKYDSALSGIRMHADFAAVNLNFWITPDTANLDPASGGLRVRTVEAPADWTFADYNASQDKIQRFLAGQPGEEVVVPYRANRAVLFNSDLFHATDTIHFRPGYENRRINVTMLFGDRVEGGPRGTTAPGG